MDLSRRQALKMAVLGTLGLASRGLGKPLDIPVLGVKADSGPLRTECGVGALIPWADRLWAVTYVSSAGGQSGSGTGLYVIDEKLDMQQVHVSNGVYANRMLHEATNQVNIGPYMIDMRGNVKVINDLLDRRLTATMTHLTDPENKLYVLTMEGPFFELDVHTLEARQLFDLTELFGIEAQPHFKGAFTAQGRVVVANNSYYRRGDTEGKLAEWDGGRWNVIEDKPYMDVFALRDSFGETIFANGWDEASAILSVRAGGEWQRYRLPKASHAYDHGWTTEWTRIREVETERLLIDCHGMFYELPAMAYGGRVWGVRPVSTHLRIVPDFCSFRGMFVMAGNELSWVGGHVLSPQPQSGIWFGVTDDLWKMGKPAGWGGPWRRSEVAAGEASDPFLMTGFEGKVLHLKNEGTSATRVRLEVDFLGVGEFELYDSFGLEGGAYLHHEFPEGFSAHWVRLVAEAPAVLTAEFIYT